MTGDITSIEGDGRSLAPATGSFTVSVSKESMTLTEGASDTINVFLNAPQSTDTVVNLSLTSPTGANRFNPIPTKLTIPAGQLSKTVLISTVDDVLIQSSETWYFAISLTNDSGTASPNQTVITLLDNDGGSTAGAGTSLTGPILLMEFNRLPASGMAGIAMLDGKILYAGTDPTNGTELWISDGTAAGTHIVKDIYPGQDSSSPTGFVLDAVTGFVYFRATTPGEGQELWRTDGTTAGTFLLADTRPGILSPPALTLMGAVNGKMYLKLRDASYVWHLYVSDGTPAGTQELAPLAIGGIGSIGNVIQWKGRAYFSIASADRYQVEFWSSDGTAAGTQSEFNLGTGDPLSAPYNYYIFQSKLYFTAYLDDFIDGPEFYSSDGTQVGTGMVKNINTHSSCCGIEDGSYPLVVGEYNGKMILSALDGTGTAGTWVSDGTTGGTVKLATGVNATSPLGTLTDGRIVFSGGSTDLEPWVSDGTLAGTFQLKDIASGSGNSSSPTAGVSLGSYVVFLANDGTSGLEPWVTDGTTVGTHMLKDINPGANSSNIPYFVRVGTKAAFAANDGVSGAELWITDGTTAGTVRVADINPGISSSGPTNFIAGDSSHAFFTAYNPSSQFATAFSLDTNTNSVTGIYNALVTTYGSGAVQFMALGSKVVFRANNNGPGNVLWTTDGTAAGTAPLVDIFPTLACTDISILGVSSGSLFFKGSTGTAQSDEVWITDGTSSGTNFFMDINPGAAGSSSGVFKSLNSGLSVFLATTTANGSEPWVTDGTVAGTHMIQDLIPGTTSGGTFTGLNTTQQLVYIEGGDKLWVTAGTVASTVQVASFGVSVSTLQYFAAGSRMYILINATSSPQLWISDGTLIGTMNITPAGGAIEYPVSIYPSTSGKCYFVFYHSTLGYQMIVNDGVAGTTTVLQSTGNNTMSVLTEFSGLVYFSTVTGTFSTDGTLAGTTLMPAAFQINNGLQVGGKVFFAGYDATNGTEPWVTDGTLSGTFMLKDICPNCSSVPTNFTSFNGKVYFVATDPVHGTELWVTDGTSGGTRLLEDINPGVASSSPTYMTVVNGKLYMVATKVLSGTEVWVMAP